MQETSGRDPGNCAAVNNILSTIGDKWTVLVVVTLSRGPMRFNELKRAVGDISQRMLTLTLRGMERDGFVKRTVAPTNPPRVDYELTPLGHSLREPVEALGRWAFDHQGEIKRAQARFDAKQADAA